MAAPAPAPAPAPATQGGGAPSTQTPENKKPSLTAAKVQLAVSIIFTVLLALFATFAILDATGVLAKPPFNAPANLLDGGRVGESFIASGAGAGACVLVVGGICTSILFGQNLKDKKDHVAKATATAAAAA